MAYARDQLIKKIAALPESIQDVLTSTKIDDVLVQIGKEYGVHIDKLGKLSGVINQIFFGEVLPDQFQSLIKNQLEITDILAKEITALVNEKIFLPIREELKKIYTDKEGKTADELHPLPTNKAEAQTHLLSAIEEPEKVPMKVSVLTAPAPVAVPATPPAPVVMAPALPAKAEEVPVVIKKILPVVEAPIAVLTAPALAPAPAPIPAPVQIPVPAQIPTPTIVPPPAPELKKPAVPVRDAATLDPYRELAK